MEDKKITVSKRSLEQATDKHYVSRIAWKLKTLLLNNSNSVQKIKDIYKSLTYQNLKSWADPYADYYFSGKNKIIDQDWFEQWSLDMFKNVDLLEDILAREDSINFDWNPKIKKQIDTLVSSLIQNKIFVWESPIVNPASKANLLAAMKQAESTNSKIVFIANHSSHFDTPILNYVLSRVIKEIHTENPEIPIKKIRFICGAYMYYNKGVRNFTAGFDTTLVFGPKDLQEIKLYLQEENRKELILKFFKEALQKAQSNQETETTLLFPYAGRAENNNGCKDELPKGIYSYLENENSIYVPIGAIWSENIFPTGDLYQVTQNINVFEYAKNIIKYFKFSQIIKLLHPKADQKQLVKLMEKAEPLDIVIRILENIDIFKLLKFMEKYKFKFFKPGNIHMTIWEHFVWWEKNLEDINTIMHDVSNQSQKYFN